MYAHPCLSDAPYQRSVHVTGVAVYPQLRRIYALGLSTVRCARYRDGCASATAPYIRTGVCTARRAQGWLCIQNC